MALDSYTLKLVYAATITCSFSYLYAPVQIHSYACDYILVLVCSHARTV